MRRLFFAIFFYVFSTALFASDKLIFAIDVIRHGDRTPVKNLPAIPHNWPEGFGELTATGMQQEFQLGAKHREQYIQTSGLLPDKYQFGTLKVFSTDFDRTLMSAESFLIGLYPQGTGPEISATKNSALPNRFQPVPIHSLSEEAPDSDKLLFRSLMKKYVYHSPAWQAETQALTPNFAKWSKLTGTSISSLSDLKSIADTLYIDEIHHVRLPARISASDANDIIAAGHWALVNSFKPYEVGNALSHAFLAKIAQYLQEASQHKSTLKYILFSAHDSTIMSLLSAMHAPLNEQPPYAADLSFQLFEKTPGDYFIQISYNGQPVILPGCNGSACSLAEFIKLFG